MYEAEPGRLVGEVPIGGTEAARRFPAVDILEEGLSAFGDAVESKLASKPLESPCEGLTHAFFVPEEVLSRSVLGEDSDKEGSSLRVGEMERRCFWFDGTNGSNDISL
mmetsp:Transcript_45931/g.93987  ORF Transcript_45931/g.93987 Transcript_45931/m.93987 type:complete len:108 (-) Transcript_45931:78-401(-)